MSKVKINKSSFERCLLTEIAPYETPILFSNWGSYNYIKNLQTKNTGTFLKRIFDSEKKPSIPYKYRIKKDAENNRTLFLAHPHHSQSIVNFYKRFDVAIIRACKKSPFSIRFPHHTAKNYTASVLVKSSYNRQQEMLVEDITAETAYASSYFSYSRYSHLHKFFDSDEFTEFEKKYSSMLHLDVSKFFPSLYTHSISWAVRGKTRTKRTLKKHLATLDATFDRLLQGFNHNETHGIIVGPELCRIFSEIILQRIDSGLFQKLTSVKIVLGRDYWCARYMDDYYLFFNDAKIKDQFASQLQDELEKFCLYINEAKSELIQRPFITQESLLKIKISEYATGLESRQDKLKSTQAHAEINKLRAIMKLSSSPFSSISSYLLAVLHKKIIRLFSKPPDNLFDSLFVYLDLSFHSFRMDIRVHNSFKISTIIYHVYDNIDSLTPSERAQITDKIIFEVRNALEISAIQHRSVECMNLFIASTLFAVHYSIPEITIIDCITNLRTEHQDEYSKVNRLSYFEIVSILYYISAKPEYAESRAMILSDANAIIKNLNPDEYSESAHLLLDLVSCPHLTNLEKDSIIQSAINYDGRAANQCDIDHFRGFVSEQSWYFNWSGSDKIKNHLRKKRYLLTY